MSCKKSKKVEISDSLRLRPHEDEALRARDLNELCSTSLLSLRGQLRRYQRHGAGCTTSDVSLSGLSRRCRMDILLLRKAAAAGTRDRPWLSGLSGIAHPSVVRRRRESPRLPTCDSVGREGGNTGTAQIGHPLSGFAVGSALRLHPNPRRHRSIFGEIIKPRSSLRFPLLTAAFCSSAPPVALREGQKARVGQGPVEELRWYDAAANIG
ncbi:uncharacterized protein MKK02DRAFT_34076 [Dioszegia hungarica]|uniref:Uncharacterized protein n=1 Tax=Dioszegia hungarica TaxID=4972 RepID=A0AA38LWQ2_9TREE|nr:uncharacterized protein MKK02DRAFT_34076 [Dioszegia hungarica]KAI9637019.1 hypothetical protein MKK02DRAFT_34076 [Dioszegia hungarica]